MTKGKGAANGKDTRDGRARVVCYQSRDGSDRCHFEFQSMNPASYRPRKHIYPTHLSIAESHVPIHEQGAPMRWNGRAREADKISIGLAGQGEKGP